ncbi:hypothetical protein Taro_015770 [Colocasia esculenta]|uniref:Uncharacterized protein n=1 Tax=Colocasia esculenta TaxID=4460 RepID=A0A843UN72_COLES|nr:hypothetical protein [Colocasia esculenta]
MQRVKESCPISVKEGLVLEAFGACSNPGREDEQMRVQRLEIGPMGPKSFLGKSGKSVGPPITGGLLGKSSGSSTPGLSGKSSGSGNSGKDILGIDPGILCPDPVLLPDPTSSTGSPNRLPAGLKRLEAGRKRRGCSQGQPIKRFPGELSFTIGEATGGGASSVQGRTDDNLAAGDAVGVRTNVEAPPESSWDTVEAEGTPRSPSCCGGGVGASTLCQVPTKDASWAFYDDEVRHEASSVATAGSLDVENRAMVLRAGHGSEVFSQQCFEQVFPLAELECAAEQWSDDLIKHVGCLVGIMFEEQENLSKTIPPRHLSRLHHHLPLVAVVFRARRHLDPCPQKAEDPEHRLDVREAGGDAADDRRTGRAAQGAGEDRESGVLGAANADVAGEVAASDDDLSLAGNGGGGGRLAQVEGRGGGEVGDGEKWGRRDGEKWVRREWASGGWSQRAMDAKLRVEYRNWLTAILMYMADDVTDREGKYRIEVDGEHDDEICESVLVSSPKSVCATPLTGRDRSRIVLSHANGVVSNKRIADNLGFRRVAAMDGCSEIMRETQERSEKQKSG